MQSLIDKKILSAQPSSIRVVFEEVLRLQKAGTKITRLDVGSPNFKGPESIIKSVSRNLQKGMYNYSSNWGVYSLRSAIANKYLERGKIRFNPKNEVIITSGASEAVAMVICTLLNNGEHFLIPTPAWPHYIANCQIFGKQHKEIATSHSDNFKLTPERLTQAIDENSRVLILNSPCNPTGGVYSKDEFKAIYGICVENQILLVLDEIYEDINFEYTASLLDVGVDKKNLIYINGFSKNFGMTGFRIGFLMADASLANQLIKYRQYTTVCGQEFVQEACSEFLADKMLVQSFHSYVLESLRGSQKVLTEFREHSNIQMTKPSGAFYSFAKIPASFPDAQAFCMQLLAQKNISLVPGASFGSGSNDFYRISYGSVGAEELSAAFEKILEYY